MGVPIIRTIVFGVYIGVPLFWESTIWDDLTSRKFACLRTMTISWLLDVCWGPWVSAMKHGSHVQQAAILWSSVRIFNVTHPKTLQPKPQTLKAYMYKNPSLSLYNHKGPYYPRTSAGVCVYIYIYTLSNPQPYTPSPKPSSGRLDLKLLHDLRCQGL